MENTFVTEGLRKRMENFSHSISGNFQSHLVFSQNTCTDGYLMQINPNIVQFYSEDSCHKICDLFNTPFDMDKVVLFDIKASTVHESAHDLLSDFKLFTSIDQFETAYGKKLLHTILNIIEDAFIEKAITSLFKGTRKYILFSNELAFLERMSLNDFEKQHASESDLFLEYFTQKVIIGKVKGEISNKHLLDVISQCENLFEAGVHSKNAKVRYDFAYKIYEILKQTGVYKEAPSKFTPFSNHLSNNNKNKKPQSSKSKSLDSEKFSDASTTEEALKDLERIKENDSKKENGVKTSINSDISEEMDEIKAEFSVLEAEKNLVNQEHKKASIPEKREVPVEYSDMNKNIHVENNFPSIQIAANYTNEYMKIFGKVSGFVNSFVQQFKKLSEQQEEYETLLEMGEVLDSSKFGRKDRKFWKESITVQEPVKIAITMLVDGSGSMDTMVGRVKETCVIIYELAKKLHIPIAIIEQRAIYGKPLVQHNIKVDYTSNIAMRYNIASLSASEGTREGVSLLYTYNFAKSSSLKNYKHLIIVISDGEPQHTNYCRPYNIEDSKQSFLKIKKDKDFTLVAIALGNSEATLREIYGRNVVKGDLSILPKQIVKIIRKNMNL